MFGNHRRALLRAAATGAVLAVGLGVAACGGDDDDDGDSGEETTEASATAIEENPDNNGIALTIGSKNFTEQIILGEIYAQALEAAGYDISTDLNLGDEQVALKALETGEISGYPEYTSTALTSFFQFAPEDVPSDAQAAFEESQDDFEAEGLVAYPPTDFSSANAVGLLTSTAEDLGVTSISDLEGQSQDLDLYGSPECRQRIDCLVGLEENYGLEFKSFTPVDIGLRYEVLDKGDADLSILFTTDAQLFVSDDYTILEDDQGVLPAGNVIFVATQEAVDEAGPDFGETIENVQGNLTLEVMQELNARVDIDREKPEDVAREYLEEFGYIQ
jgi:osmoprotectant transport system substrate-binding protein